MATKAIEVTPQTWIKVGTGPLLIEAKQSDNAYIHFGTTPPALSTIAHHDLRGPDGFSYGGSETCYARATTENVTLIVTQGVS